MNIIREQFEIKKESQAEIFKLAVPYSHCSKLIIKLWLVKLFKQPIKCILRFNVGNIEGDIYPKNTLVKEIKYDAEYCM